jgi:hypothetical protein
MTSYTNIFGGQTIFPAMLNLRQIALSANLVLEWPTETASTSEVVAYIMQVTPAAGSLEIAMPPADETSNGMSVLFTNEGASTYTVTDTGGNSILTIAAGETWDLWIVSNATANGTWNSAQRGATTGSVNVAALAGKGLKAITTTLNQDYPISSISTNYAASTADRAKFFVWTSGAGTFDLDDPSTVGDGWFCSVRNGGDGALTVTPASGTINDAASIDLQPDDSCMIVTDGSEYFTYGLGVQATFAFDFVSINIAGSGNYTLSGAELNRIAYQFTGLLTGNRDIIVPSTTQQYWVTNDTTGAYVLGVRTSTQASPGITVDQGESSIMYCNGTDVVDGDTQGISLPVAVAQGGTGATTASGARTNLGATSVGDAVFTASNAAAARTAIGNGTMSTQDATAVAITGGTLDAVAITNASAVGLTSADAGAAAAPTLDLYRNSATPAASDVIGQITLTGEDSAGNTQTYGVIDGLIVDPTSTSEDGRVRISTAVAGTVAVRMYVDNGVVVGSATGADQGAGTVNATGLYVNGVAVGTQSYAAKVAGYTVIATDNGAIINWTTAAATADLTAAATLGSGFSVTLMNTASTGDVTIAPDGAETLDGLASRLLRPGDRATIVCDGSNWFTAIGVYSFTSTAITPALSSVGSASHGLGMAPTSWGAVFKCTSTDGGWAVDDEVDYNSVQWTYGGALGANATTVYATMPQTYTPALGNRSTGAGFNIDYAKWDLILSAEVAYA